MFVEVDRTDGCLSRVRKLEGCRPISVLCLILITSSDTRSSWSPFEMKRQAKKKEWERLERRGVEEEKKF